MSCYASGHATSMLYNRSWLDAQRICDEKGSHLWTINSHEEWHNVYDRTFGRSELDSFRGPHFFIGLIYSSQDRNKKVRVFV